MITCKACGRSPHAFMRLERVVACCFNGTFAVLSFVTFSWKRSL